MGKYQEFTKQLMLNSVSTEYYSALKEWKIIDYIKITDYVLDNCGDVDNTCVCGHKNIVHAYTIQNQRNGAVLEPIGSECIKKFFREELVKEGQILRELYELWIAFMDGKKVILNATYFSRKLLKHFYDIGVLGRNAATSEYNYFKLKRLFNKRSMSRWAKADMEWADSIIKQEIEPYLMLRFIE